MLTCTIRIAFLLTTLLAATVAQAAPVALTNASFEDPDAGSGGFISGVPTGWVGPASSLGTMGVIDENRASVTDTPFGDQWLHLQNNGNVIGQQLGAGLEFLGGTIDLSYIATRRQNEGTNMNHNVSIVAGSGVTFEGGEVLDLVNYDIDLPDNGDNTFATIDLMLDASGNAMGNTQLWLVFENNVESGTQLHIDNVSVNATAVPEPRSIAIWLCVATITLGAVTMRRRVTNRN